MHHMPSHGGKCVLVFFLCFLMFHLYLFVLCLSLALCPFIFLMSSLFFFREPFCLATSTRVRTFGAPSFPGHDVLHASENPGFAKKSNQPIHNLLTTSSHMFTKFANFCGLGSGPNVGAIQPCQHEQAVCNLSECEASSTLPGKARPKKPRKNHEMHGLSEESDSL